MSRPPFTLDLPSPAADHPRWARASVLAIAGFALGVLLPRILDVKMGPNPPTDGRAAVHVTTGSAKAVAAPAPTLEMPGTPATRASHEARVEIAEGQVTACRDQTGKAGKTCAPVPLLDAALAVPLRTLTKCPSVMGLSGKLSLGFDVDFKKKTLKPQRGKSTTLPTTTVEGMLKCLEKPLTVVSLDGAAQDQAKLTVFYQMTFVPPGKVDPAPEPEPLAEKTAAENQDLEVAWKSCTLRDSPRNGAAVGKIAKGTKLKLIEKKGDWLKVSVVGSKQEGWIIKTATEK